MLNVLRLVGFAPVIAVALLGLLIGPGFTPPTADAQSSVIHACINPSGLVRIIGPTGSCSPSEKAISWPATSGTATTVLTGGFPWNPGASPVIVMGPGVDQPQGNVQNNPAKLSVRMPAGTARNLRVRILRLPSSPFPFSTLTFIVQNASAPTATTLQCVISPPSTSGGGQEQQCENVTDALVFAAGDALYVSAVASGIFVDAETVTWSVELDLN